MHATFAREQEYKRHGTLSLLAGIDLVSGRVHALVKDRHRSCEFIEFLKLLDAAYPAPHRDQVDSREPFAHISKETRASVAEQPAHRFEFTFTPTHGSWLNLIEGFFSKLPRSVLRHIRVASKQELNRMATYCHKQPEEARITYRFHPRFGELVQIRQQFQRGGCKFVVLVPDGSFASFPAWMTEPAASRFEIGDEPRFPLHILRSIRVEVDTLLAACLDNRPTYSLH